MLIRILLRQHMSEMKLGKVYRMWHRLEASGFVNMECVSQMFSKSLRVVSIVWVTCYVLYTYGTRIPHSSVCQLD